MSKILYGSAGRCEFRVGWSDAGRMDFKRAGHTASILTNGKVLVAGGGYRIITNRTELYDPSTVTWTIAGSMSYPRYFHAAFVLINGKVLVTGGYNDKHVVLNSTELYDPSTETWTTTDSMGTGR
jgi:N-acetylneuraminic acid mutarotase